MILEIQRKHLGLDHPTTLYSLWHFSYALKAHGQDSEEEELLEQYMRLASEKFGPDHESAQNATVELEKWKISTERGEYINLQQWQEQQKQQEKSRKRSIALPFFRK
ncbi:hypothetical protein BDV12DRAFT_191891 [Aspergillus spectabilis]